MRALGIDFGEKRIGLAISDPEGRLALPLRVISRTDDRSAILEIAAIARREEVTHLVVGEPRGPQGRVGAAARRARSFARKLQRETELPLELIDEGLTSHEAVQRLRQLGVDPTRHPERIDQVAAQIVLEDALERHRRQAG
jgi:putative Holliday junction resolvase